MIINIELSEELEKLFLTDAKTNGTSPEVLLGNYLADIYSYAIPREGSSSAADIADCLEEFDAMRASGENGIDASAVHNDLRAALKAQSRNA